MPRITAKVLKVKENENGMQALLLFNGKLPPEGEQVSVKWGKERTLSQNALYWKYLNWLIEDAGLKDQGHFSPLGFHEDLKAYFLAEKIVDKKAFGRIENSDLTTTEMTRAEFGEYFDKCDEFVSSFFNIDTSPFWIEYQQNYGGEQ